MKFIRFLLIALATAAALALLLVGAAFTPPIQTWFARMELLDQPGVQGSLGSVSASFGKMELEDLKVRSGGIVLTLPSLQATLPIIKAAWRGQFLVRSVVAKGWTLDLSRLGETELEVQVAEASGSTGSLAPSTEAPAKQAALAFSGILTGRRLPFDGSLDGVDIEGDVLVALAPGKTPARVHVSVTGGGMAQGREGSFTIDAARVADDPDSTGNAASARCRLIVSMDSPRSVGRLEIKADLNATTGPGQVAITVAAEASKTPGGGDESYSLDLARGERHLAALSATFPASPGRLAGKWALDLVDSDFAAFVPDRPLPAVAVSGTGQFNADISLERIRASGRLVIVASRLDAVAPEFERLGTLTADTRFDMERRGHSIHVDSLGASISGVRPVAEIRTLQPFDFDHSSKLLKVGDPRLDLIDVSIMEFPLARLPVMPGGITFSRGAVSGEIAIRATDRGFLVHGTSPLAAAGATVERAGKPVVRDLELSVPLVAELSAEKWQFQWSPVTIGSGGRHLATIEAKGSLTSGANQALEVSGNWKADLDALASTPALSGIGWISGRSASGDFTAAIGSSKELECKLDVVGHDPAHTLSATINADEDPGGAGEFLAPMRISFGSDVSVVTAEASWAGGNAESRSEIKLSGESVGLGDLRLLAAPLAAAGGSWAVAGSRDRVPFWGDWTGRVTVTFDKLRTGDEDFTDVGGSFEVDHASIQLEGGHAELPSKSMARLEGSILYDAGGDHPYILKATAGGLSNIDSALLLPPKAGEPPVIEGRFTVAGSISGSGDNLDELIDGTTEEFKLASSNGIIRMLRTDVADAIPEAKEPVSDSLGDVGNFMGSILGIKGHSIDPGKNKVSTSADAVINFTNQVGEIGYDKISVTAVRGSDRSIRLTDLEMTAADEHLKGSGEIAYVKGLPISEEPLSVDLQLGVRDVLVRLLSTAGLLSPGKDGLGYSLMSQPVHLGGTLLHIDDKRWHDLLAKAATQKPAAANK